MTTTKQDQEFREIYNAALAAGVAAGEAVSCVPMVVGSPSTPLGNDIDYSKQTYFVPDGVCGFAWITIPDGRSAFAKWLKAQGVAHKGYPTGVDIWVHKFGQSLQRKEACARAAAKVFNDRGIKAYAGSRMD